MRCRARVILILAAAALAPACSVLPKAEIAPELFRLTPVTRPATPGVVQASAAPLPWQVVVQAPLAALSLDTNRIAVETSAHEIKYLQGVRWSDNAAQLVQEALLESLDGTERFAAVGRPSGGLHADYALVCELKEFEADLYSGGHPVVRIRMRLQLVKQPVGTIAASRTFSAETPADNRSTLAIVQAFDEGLHGLMIDVGDWAAASLPASRTTTEAAVPLRRSVPERKASSEMRQDPAATP